MVAEVDAKRSDSVNSLENKPTMDTDLKSIRYSQERAGTGNLGGVGDGPILDRGSKLGSWKAEGLKQEFRESVAELKRKENHLQALKAERQENKGLMKRLNQSLRDDRASIERKIKLHTKMLQEKGRVAAQLKYWETLEASSRISNAMEARLNADLAAQRRALDKERVALLAREKKTIRDMAMVTEYEEMKLGRYEARERRHEMMTQLSLYTAKINALKNQTRFDEANFWPPTPLSHLSAPPNFRKQQTRGHGDTRLVTKQTKECLPNRSHRKSPGLEQFVPSEVIKDAHAAAERPLPVTTMVPRPPTPRPGTRPLMVLEGKVTRHTLADSPRNGYSPKPAREAFMSADIGTTSPTLQKLQAEDAGLGNKLTGSLSDNKVTLPLSEATAPANCEEGS